MMSLVKKGIQFIAIVVCLYGSNIVFGQQLTLFNVDTAKYPTVKADFFAVDHIEKQITTLMSEDVFISENGSAQEVIRVTNPAASKIKQLSLVLTMDISGSMLGPNMELARSAVKAIVNKLPLDISECAITSFDDESFVNADFTRDKNRLLKTIETLTPVGGTNYNKGLNRANAGGLDILKNGLHEKVLIFLTDGYGEVDPSAIIQKAKSMNAKVYVITLGMRTPEELKRITAATGGNYYENIVSDDDIKTVYLSILYRSQGMLPSTVEWISTPGCGYAKALVFGEKKNTLKQAEAQYTAPAKHIVRLITDENTITFTASVKEVSVPLKAINGDFYIKSFNSSAPSFSMVTPALPYTIKKDASASFIITYTGSSTVFISGRIELISTGCQSTFIYYQYQPVSDKPVINLVAPDGKEIFYTGEDTLIRWSLQNTTEPVKISFSSDAGKKWTVIKDSTRADHFNWKIPDAPGTTNIIKVETRAAAQTVKPESKMVYDGFTGIMNAYNLSPDGARYISQTTAELFLHDTYTNAVIHKIKNPISKGYFIFSPDGKYIYIYDEDKPIKVYDGRTFEFIKESGVFQKTLSSYIEPYINNDLTEYVARRADGSLGIFNFTTGALIKKLPFIKGEEVTEFTSNYIVTLDATNHYVWVWDYVKGIKVTEIQAPNERIVNAELNKDENVLIVSTWGMNGAQQNFTAYNLQGKQLYKYENSLRAFMSLDTYDNYALCSVNNYPALIDINTGKVLLTYSLPKPVKFGWFVPFSHGQYILFTSTSAAGDVYMVTSGVSDLQDSKTTDQSASVFTIRSTKPEVKTVRFPSVYIGNAKDSVIIASIKNVVPVNIEIKELSVEGAAEASFKILTPITPFTILKKSAQNLEIRFAPVTSGVQNAVLKVVTAYDTIRVALSGTGVVRPYALTYTELNMGLVEVGKTKDSIFLKVITNTSAGTLYVTSINCMGPDKTQFKIVSPTVLSLAPGASAEIKLLFSPVQRGRTSTELRIAIRGAVDPYTLPVYAEGYLPRKYVVQYNFIDAVTKASVTAEAVCIDQQSAKPVECVYTNNGERAVTTAYADRIYVFTITKKGYKTVTDTVNLQRIIRQDNIVKTIELISESGPSIVTQVISGSVFIKSTNTPLSTSISIYSTTNKTLVKIIESAPDGKYNVTLPIGVYYIQIEKEGYVNENGTMVISSGTQALSKNFELTPIVVGETISLPNVYFARGGVTLLESSNESLDQLYTLLNDNPTMRIELQGYTDNQGDPKLNIQLSEQRVASIKEYLVQKGIAENRITGKGYGGAKPIASNATEETRQLNRRVEFKIVSK
jgi:outer membrane protein OmpA-like peptidoglycan-associated protein/WD40 repeat protein